MRRCLKYILIGLIMFTFTVNFETVKAAEKTISCDYRVTIGGGAEYYAKCAFTIDDEKLKSHKCEMSYYFEGKVKTKNKKVANDINKSNFIYSLSGDSFEEAIVKTKQCPSYAVGYYEYKKSIFGNDKTETLIYMAADEASKDNLLSTWGEANTYIYSELTTKDRFLLVLRNSQIGYSEAEVSSIFEKIEKHTKTIQEKIDDYNIENCRNDDVLYTKYTECEKKINSIETIYKSLEKDVNDYISNYNLNEDDEQIQKFRTVVKNAKELISENKSIINNYDCERKLELGLVKNCSKDIVSEEENPTITSVCNDMGETGKLLRQIYNLLKYLIPVLVIGLSIADFLKVVVSGEEKIFKETWAKFVKRIIIGIIILILPMILSLVINLSGVLDDYDVDKNNIFCILK